MSEEPTKAAYAVENIDTEEDTPTEILELLEIDEDIELLQPVNKYGAALIGISNTYSALYDYKKLLDIYKGNDLGADQDVDTLIRKDIEDISAEAVNLFGSSDWTYEDLNPKAIVMEDRDSFKEAILGTTPRGCVVYSCSKLIEVFMTKDGMDADEAVEWIDYNVLGSYMQGLAPLYLMDW